MINLFDACLFQISHFKIPKYVQFLTEFPKTGSGKIKKHILKAAMEKAVQAGDLWAENRFPSLLASNICNYLGFIRIPFQQAIQDTMLQKSYLLHAFKGSNLSFIT